jgi:branched-chain amino acid transport system ATP-binding protein
MNPSATDDPLSVSSAPATSKAAGANPLVDVQGVTKRFGGIKALTDVSFSVDGGMVTGLIGPNGAGKTTLFNTITGFLRPDTGRVYFEGRRIDHKSPEYIARLGMVRSFQSIRMFKGLTVYESLLVARPRERPWSNRESKAKVSRMLEHMQLTDIADRVCNDLPLLAQRRIEVARALMTDPTILLLDEPSAGATVLERSALADLISGLKSRGTTVIVIEHNVPFVMKVSDKVVVLDFGKKVAEGTPAEIADNPIVQDIYLGSDEKAGDG